MQMISDADNERKAASEFFEGLKEHLNKTISPRAVSEWIQEEKDSSPKRKHVQYEGLFIDKFVLPKIPAYLRKVLEDPTTERIREAFLAESSRARQDGITSDSPISADKRLFTKVLGPDFKAVVKSWWGESKKKPISQSCPDWAFRPPCPYTVIFEGKLFRSGGIDAARSELIKGIYECFYYRAHPYRGSLNRPRFNTAIVIDSAILSRSVYLRQAFLWRTSAFCSGTTLSRLHRSITALGSKLARIDCLLRFCGPTLYKPSTIKYQHHKSPMFMRV